MHLLDPEGTIDYGGTTATVAADGHLVVLWNRLRGFPEALDQIPGDQWGVLCLRMLAIFVAESTRSFGHGVVAWAPPGISRRSACCRRAPSRAPSSRSALTGMG
jgi:hypothetical protein